MDDPSPQTGPDRRISRVSIVLVSVCVAVEALLQLSDLGLIDTRRLRLRAYEYAGFWPGLLGDWRPNYVAQPVLMFLTYGFLHTGLAHLAVNMITLVSLGRMAVQRVGEWRYLAIYAGSILGGAIGYLALASTPQPMVGASGALFGLAGAVLAWEIADRRKEHRSLVPILGLVALFAVLNVVLWWAMGGRLAWETHLGGAVTGFALAVLLPQRAMPGP